MPLDASEMKNRKCSNRYEAHENRGLIGNTDHDHLQLIWHQMEFVETCKWDFKFFNLFHVSYSQLLMWLALSKKASKWHEWVYTSSHVTPQLLRTKIRILYSTGLSMISFSMVLFVKLRTSRDSRAWQRADISCKHLVISPTLFIWLFLSIELCAWYLHLQ